MRKYWDEFIHAISKKWVIIAIILVIFLSVISGLPLSSYSSSNNSITVEPLSNGAYIVDNGTLHIYNQIYTNYGIPIRGATVNTIVNKSGDNPYSGTMFNFTTNKYGFANETINGVNSSNFTFITSFVAFLQNRTPSGQVVYPKNNPSPNSSLKSGIGKYQIATVYNINEPNLNDIHIFYVGPNGTVSPRVNIYANIVQANSSTSNDSILLGSYSSFNSLNLAIGTRNAMTYDKPIDINITNVNGTPLTVFGGTNINIGNPRIISNNILLSFFVNYEPLIFFLFPIVGLMFGFYAFGGDNIMGTIEQTVTRPVTVRSIILSRILVLSLLSLIAPAISLSVSNTLDFYYTGLVFPVQFNLIFGLSLIVETISFSLVGIIFSFYSKNLKTYYILIVFYIMCMSFLWNLPNLSNYNPIIASLTGFTISNNSLMPWIIYTIINPSSLPLLSYLISTDGGQVHLVNPAIDSIGHNSLIIAGTYLVMIAWVFVPLLIVLHLSKKKWI